MNEENIYYIIEVCVGGEKLYMYSKRIAVHFPDISKKFVHKRPASRYYKDSEFTECYHRILKYDKEKDEIILWVVFIYNHRRCPLERECFWIQTAYSSKPSALAGNKVLKTGKTVFFIFQKQHIHNFLTWKDYMWYNKHRKF